MSTSANTEAAESSSPGKRCAACKNQRRKCAQDCVLAPYFPATDPQRYACVQRVFGASNVARMLQNLPVHERARAADTMAMEARRRVQDPVYGCAGIVGRLQGEIRAAQCELARTQAQIAVHAAAAAARAHPAPVVDAQAAQHASAAPLQQQDDDDDARELFQGLDALLVDDYRWDALTRLL
ncbi:LOB domain-containing protein 24-like [Miscanthus floridulus]|uniref:LOB domain-containing protein 24-like n=1 Tax=Miscanthus floridulus TaxID=154761 RepID=UPI0034577260